MASAFPDDKRFFATEFCVKPAVVNLLLGTLVTWAIYRSTPMIPFWGKQGIVVDLVNTSVIITVLTYPVTKALVRMHVRNGRLQGFQAPTLCPGPVRLLPSNALLRTVCLAAAIVAALVAPVVLVCSALGIDGTLPSRFLPLKAVFSAAVGAAASLACAAVALADLRPRQLRVPD